MRDGINPTPKPESEGETHTLKGSSPGIGENAMSIGTHHASRLASKFLPTPRSRRFPGIVLYREYDPIKRYFFPFTSCKTPAALMVQ